MTKNTSLSIMDKLSAIGCEVSEEAKMENIQREKRESDRNKDKYKNFQNNAKKNFNPSSTYSKNSQNNNRGNGYVGAPYNFVPFNEKVYALSEEDIIPHDAYTADNYSGELTYTITAHTPICVCGIVSGTKDNEFQVFY